MKTNTFLAHFVIIIIILVNYSDKNSFEHLNYVEFNFQNASHNTENE